MAYATTTLTGTYQILDGTPAAGTIEIIPSESVIKDTAGNVILSGRVKVALDDQGKFSVALPATDDPDLNPTGFGYTVVAKLRHQHLAAVSFSLPAGSPVDMEDVTPVDVSSFTPTTTYVEEGTLAPVATSGAITDLTGVATDAQLPTRLSDETLKAEFAPGVSLPAANGTDDTAALQAVLSAHGGQRIVGVAGQSYKISAPLVIASGTTLDMTGCTITLLPNSNCALLQNAATDNPVATATDGAVTNGSNVVTTSLAATAQIGQTLTLSNGYAVNSAQPLVGYVTATTATTVTLSDYLGKPMNAMADVSAGTVRLFNRDSHISLIGGIWDRGANTGVPVDGGWLGIRLEHIDHLLVRDLTSYTSGHGDMMRVSDCAEINLDNLHLECPTNLTSIGAIQLHGPISMGVVSGITGASGDDFVALQTSDVPNGQITTAGPINNVTVRDIRPIWAGQSIVKLRAAQIPMRAVVVDGVGGAAGENPIGFKAASDPVNDVADLTVSNVDAVADTSAPVYLFSTASTGKITLRNITNRSLAAGTNSSLVLMTSAVNLGALEIDGLNLTASGYGVLVAGTVKSLKVTNVTVSDTTRAIKGAVSVGSNAVVTSMHISHVKVPVAITGTYYVAYLQGNTPNIHIEDVYLAGGGVVVSGASTATAGGTVVLENVTLDGASYLASSNVAMDFLVTNLNVRSITNNGIIGLPSGALVTVRGSGLLNPTGRPGFSGTSTVPPRVVHPTWPVDVSTIAQNLGDTAYNTNAAVAGGAGPVVSNGTAWTNLTVGGSGGGSTNPILAASKAASTTRNNTNTRTADPDLSVAVAANSVYIMEAYLVYEATTTADFNIAWSGPAGATMDKWSAQGLNNGATNSTSALQVNPATQIAQGWILGGVGAGSPVQARPMGLLRTGASSGNLVLNWSQVTAEVSDAILYAGSWVRLTKIA